MDKETVEECKDILETAEEIVEDFFRFSKSDHTGKRIATLAVAKMLLQLELRE